MIGAFCCQLYFAISRNIQRIIVMKDGKKEVGVVLNWSESEIIAYFKRHFFAYHCNIPVENNWSECGVNLPEDAHCYLFAAIFHMLNLKKDARKQVEFFTISLSAEPADCTVAKCVEGSEK